MTASPATDPRLPRNLRDLGGLQTRTGERLAFGRLFRSNHCGDLDDDAHDAVCALGLRTIVDLRGVDERAAKPHGLRIEALADLHLPIEPQAVTALAARVAAGDPPQQAARLAMIDAYRRFVTEHRAVFAALLHRLTEPASYPLLFHCTAGKDRTGFAAALVLSALEVPHEAVLENYLQSNGRWQPARGSAWGGLLADVRPEYLQASFEEIDRGWGGTDEFLASGLGFGAPMRARLRDCLLAR